MAVFKQESLELLRQRIDIVEVVESFSGKPVPAKEIRKRLPTDYVTTDEQVKSIAKVSVNIWIEILCEVTI